MSALAVALLVVVGVGIGFAVALARSGRKGFDDANVIVEGRDTGAPAEWGVAHTPEARLHRRIRDAVRALQADPALAGTLSGERQRIEEEALAIDERLVAAAALPESVRAPVMARVEAAVVQLEAAAARSASAGFLTEESVIGDSVEAISERLRSVAEARAELDREFPTTPGHPGEERPEPEGGLA